VNELEEMSLVTDVQTVGLLSPLRTRYKQNARHPSWVDVITVWRVLMLQFEQTVSRCGP
jgi:hypothetical protein